MRGYAMDGQRGTSTAGEAAGDVLQRRDLRTPITMRVLEARLQWLLASERYRPTDAARLQLRRRRLIDLFNGTACWDAADLHARLMFRQRGDALAESFHYRLATPTRLMLLGILQRRSCPPVQLEGPESAVVRRRPMYQYEHDPRTVGFGDVMSEWETPHRRRPQCPPFRLECVAGCPPLPANRCRAIVCRAIVDAINLASNAATALGSTRPDPETIRLFRFFFGHRPSQPVPWLGNRPSGLTVAHRFRRCAEELAGGRMVTYRCVTNCLPTENARTQAALEPSVIELCPRFFNRPTGLPLGNQFFRAGVVLHEMLHLLFHQFFHHPGHPSGDPVRRRDNAHCYEALALRLAGHAAEPGDVASCRNQPA
jgi:hypothetical protein